MNKDQKIESIEIKIAYLEDYTEKLNAVILNHQKEIEFLRKTIENLELKMTDDPEEIREQEKPPHY